MLIETPEPAEASEAGRRKLRSVGRLTPDGLALRVLLEACRRPGRVNCGSLVHLADGNEAPLQHAVRTLQTRGLVQHPNRPVHANLAPSAHGLEVAAAAVRRPLPPPDLPGLPTAEWAELLAESFGCALPRAQVGSTPAPVPTGGGDLSPGSRPAADGSGERPAATTSAGRPPVATGSSDHQGKVERAPSDRTATTSTRPHEVDPTPTATPAPPRRERITVNPGTLAARVVELARAEPGLPAGQRLVERLGCTQGGMYTAIARAIAAGELERRGVATRSSPTTLWPVGYTGDAAPQRPPVSTTSGVEADREAVLQALRDGPGRTYGAIARAIGLTGSTCYRRVLDLEAGGQARRGPAVGSHLPAAVGWYPCP